MKEQDVRQRIESFLKRTAREVVIPVSMGLGLALTGCSDVPTLYPPYGVPPMLPDAGADVPVAIVPYGVPPMPDASAQEVGLPDVSMDTAAPDVGVDTVARDAGEDTGTIDGETD